MSGNELTMDEKYFDLQNKLIEAKLSSISNALDLFGKDVKKILDDHESRLREQAKISSVSAQDIVTLGVTNSQEVVTLKNDVKELKQEIITLRNEASTRLEFSTREREERAKRELSLWQTIGIEAIKYAVLGASSGGVIVAIIKLFGIAF